MITEKESQIPDKDRAVASEPLLEENIITSKIIAKRSSDLLSAGSLGEIAAEQKCTKLLVLTAIFTTLGTAVPSGYAIAVMNNPASHMRRWCNETLHEQYDIYASESAIDLLWSSIVSIFLVGGAVGTLSGAWMADKFGRKPSILVCGILFLIAGICFYTCRILNSIETLFIGRVIVGFATGLTIPCLPLYLSEIAPLKLRGAFGVCCPAGLTTGIVVGQILSLKNMFGSAESWHIALCFYVVLVLIYLLPYCYYPESPKWLIALKCDAQAAESELIRLRGSTNMQVITIELKNMKVEASECERSSSFKEVITDVKLKLPLILLCVYQGLQQLSGINAIFNYSVLIFCKAGFSSTDAEWANLGLGILSFIAVLICPVLMTKFNRRPLMLFSSICCFISLFAFGIFLHFIEVVKWFPIGCILAVFANIVFYQMGVGPIPFFIGSELFDVPSRSVAMSIGSLTNFIGCFIACMSFPSLQNIWGPIIFAPLSTTYVIIFLLTYFYLPETRGRNSVEVASIVSKGFKTNIRKQVS